MDAEEKSGRHGHGLTLEVRPAIGTYRAQFHARDYQMQRKATLAIELHSTTIVVLLLPQLRRCAGGLLPLHCVLL